MPDQRHCYVYMLASKTRRLYVGMTDDLHRRVLQHRTKAVEGFASTYNIERLVWYESTSQVLDAIAREKQVKGWRREKKVDLIEEDNPGWTDLARDWYR
jgi:putative endonuclease